MKKIFIALMLVCFLAGGAWATGVMTETVEGYTVSLSFMGGHAKMGDNHVIVSIVDRSGVELKDARVKIEYSMPPEKGMTPMNYKARARYKGDAYKAKLNLSMGGQWIITVNALKADGEMLKTRYSVTVEEGNGSSTGHGGM